MSRGGGEGEEEEKAKEIRKKDLID